MSDIRIPQNPGIAGLTELTTIEKTFLQNIAALSYTAGDILYYNGSSITNLPIGTIGYALKVNGAGTGVEWGVVSGSGTVDSVNTQTGVVVLDADDISDAATTNKFVTATDITNLGNLSGTNTGDQTNITGNAGTATALQTARTIAGVSFDGTANISLNNNAITNGAGYTTNTGDALVANPLSQFAATTSAQLAGVISDETGSGALVFGTSPTLTTPILGTPTSGTLTNCTGLPVAGITASTSTALGVGSIELGHATDTTLSRSSAGVLAVEGVVIPSISSTNTLTNKRIIKREQTTADTATLTIDSDSYDIATVTALAQAMTIAAPTGTPTQGQSIIIRIKDNATARALTWNATWKPIGVTLPTTTVISKLTYVGAVYNSTSSQWDVLAVGQEA